MTSVATGGLSLNVSSPEIRTTLENKWSYLPRVYTLGEESETTEMFVQKLKKDYEFFENLKTLDF